MIREERPCTLSNRPGHFHSRRGTCCTSCCLRVLERFPLCIWCMRSRRSRRARWSGDRDCTRCIQGYLVRLLQTSTFLADSFCTRPSRWVGLAHRHPTCLWGREGILCGRGWKMCPCRNANSWCRAMCSHCQERTPRMRDCLLGALAFACPRRRHYTRFAPCDHP